MSWGRAKVVLLCALAAGGFGVLFNLIELWICPEIFTLAEGLYYTFEQPWIAVVSGLVGPLAVGGCIGVVMARVAHSPGLPPTPLSRLAWLILLLQVSLFALAVLAGAAGYFLDRAGWIDFPENMRAATPPAKHSLLQGLWLAEVAAYLGGPVAAVWLIQWIWIGRGSPPEAFHRSPGPYSRILRGLLIATFVICLLWACITRTD